MNEGQWPQVARNWRRIGPPLRPADADLAFVEAAMSAWHGQSGGRAPRGLILGVTPELYRLPWPDPTLLRAADRTPEMIEYVWPGPREAVLRSDWRDLDVPDASFDIVLCDGGLHLLDYPDGQAALARTLARVVAPDGLVVLRLFTPPERAETVAEVLAALEAGAVSDLNRLKLRLGNALQASPEAGVALQEVWRTLRGVAADWPELAARLGWSLEHLAVIDAYRDSGARYYFVSLPEVRDLFEAATGGAFALARIDSPAYVMGAQCPTVTFRRLAGAAGHD